VDQSPPQAETAKPIRQANVSSDLSVWKHDHHRGELETLDDTCVTVFGFPENYLSKVLKSFASYGEVINYQKGEGNWVHIRFANKLQAEKALTKNGMVLEGVMIGVVPSSTKRGVVKELVTDMNPFVVARSTGPMSSYQVDSGMPRTAPVPTNSVWAKVMEYIFGM